LVQRGCLPRADEVARPGGRFGERICGGLLRPEATPPGWAMKFDESRRLQRRAHQLIPGGAHTYAKGDDQYPEDAPGFIARGSGAHVWDVDGNEFIEYGAGLRAVTLGHGYAPVVEAALGAMREGINFVRPSRLEVELAERFLS